MELYPFNALLARMKYIARWGLMRAARTESLSEHTAERRHSGAHAVPCLSNYLWHGCAP